ncbi:MAG TPA: VOC family protein [Bryobacteraceae bacterium]
MKRLYSAALALCATLLLAGAVRAQVGLDSVRIAAKDTISLAKFYQAAFGMQEVNRVVNPTGTEVFVNFGATVEEAKANKSPLLILFHRESDDVKDPIPHIIFYVKDMAAAGGSMTGEPRPFRGESGVVLGFAVDPAGNRIELIHRP